MVKNRRRVIVNGPFVTTVILLVVRLGIAAEIDGRVVGVTDGDTIVVVDAGKTQHLVRLAAIDAPEFHQPFGRRAKQSLSRLVFGKSVAIMFKHSDRWGRIVGRVLVERRDVNLKQIVDGYAWYNRRYRYELNAADRPLYEAAEKEAQVAHRGLWADKNPVPPWKWRRVKHSAAIAVYSDD